MRSQALLTPAGWAISAVLGRRIHADDGGSSSRVIASTTSAEGEGVLLFPGHAGVIDDLQQEIAEFLAQVPRLSLRPGSPVTREHG